MRRLRKWLCVLVPATALGLLMPAAAPAAVDMFLKIDGIQGESRDRVHKDEIDVLAWSWGMSNPGVSATRSPGAASGKVNVQDLSFTKYIDRSTPALMRLLATGGRARFAELTVRKAGERPLEYLVFCFGNVGVASLSTGGSGGEDRLTENVTLNFNSFVTRYTEQSSDGSAGKAFEFGWDLVKSLELGSGASACGPGS